MFSPKEKFNVVVFGKCRDRTFDEFTRKKKKKKKRWTRGAVVLSISVFRICNG